MATVTLKGNPVHTNGDLPPVGSKAPDFHLVDQDLNDVRLSDFRGKPKLMNIVPSLDTSVCALSAKKFDDYAKSHPAVVILTVSADLPFAQKRFCGAEDIANVRTLSMMRSRDFAEDYGVLIQNGPLAGICARAVVVLDDQDRVVYTELVSDIGDEPNYAKALEALG